MSTSFNDWMRHIRTGLVLLTLASAGLAGAQGDPSEVFQRLDSPDGSQSAQVTVMPCEDTGEQVTSYERLDLIDNDTGETQLIAEQVINCEGLGASGLWVRRWSDNGEFLYYTDEREGIPDGMAAGRVAPLWRLRLADMQVERLGQALLSPDGKWLAAWTQAQISVMPAEATDGTDFTLLPADLLIVEVIWLPDNSGLLTIQADAPFAGSRSAVSHIDVETMELSLLLETGN